MKTEYFFPNGNDGIGFLEFAREFGIDPDVLSERLSEGCPLAIAALLPEKLDIEAIYIDGNRELSFRVVKPLFEGSSEEILNFFRNPPFFG